MNMTNTSDVISSQPFPVKEGLVNIALGRSASQSSYSQWSHDGEAAKAVSGVFEDYAFHTEKEDTPWWKLDLGAVYPIEAIIVHNRLHLCRERARTIKIEIAERLDEWLLIHAGYVHFGARGYGHPLEMWLGSEVKARYVKISLGENQYLHLSQVEILVRADLFAFDQFCNRHGLPHYYREESGTNCKYILEKSNDAVPNEIVGLKINYSGRFGNLMHQYLNAIQFVKKTNLKYIQLGSHELFDVKESFVLDGITFLPPNAPLPADGFFISGEFFNSDDFVPILSPFLRFRSEDEETNTAISQEFLRGRILTGVPLPNEQHPADELTIHIRAGDIFSSDHPVTYGYRQPPLSFYILVINRLREDGRINRVRLVYEDRGNPCIEALEQWLDRNSLPFRTQCGSLREDMSALIDAPHLAFGHGTFGYAACRLSKRIETVHFFEPELGGCYAYIPSIEKVYRIFDSEGKYIKAYQYGVPFGPDEGWRNTVEMRQKMLTYPIEWLQLEEAQRHTD